MATIDFTCNMCVFSSRTQKGLSVHLRKVHGISLFNRPPRRNKPHQPRGANRTSSSSSSSISTLGDMCVSSTYPTAAAPPGFYDTPKERTPEYSAFARISEQGAQSIKLPNCSFSYVAWSCPYMCSFCGFRTPFKNDLLSHVQNVHWPNSMTHDISGLQQVPNDPHHDMINQHHHLQPQQTAAM